MVACVCELVPELARAESARVCSSVLLSIDDTDPVVLPPLWAAVLHVLSAITVITSPAQTLLKTSPAPNTLTSLIPRHSLKPLLPKHSLKPPLSVCG